ncbi:MAG: hypothetical protein WBF66_10180 [Dehalococcoidia bacterium]
MAEPRRAPARRRPRRSVARGFYGDALDDAERVALEAAGDINGLDQEIALLRTKLRRALEERPQDLPLMLKGIELLVKAVSARYRLSKEAKQDLSESIAGVLRGLGGVLYPEGFADA